jgi:hypothetical protein
VYLKQEGYAMVRSASLFSQLLKQIPRPLFAELVIKHQAERNAKGFTCWSQFVSMLFCQLARADSLREITNGLACCLGKLRHLDLARAPSRSGLSYANQRRPAALFEDTFWALLSRFRETGQLGARKRQFRFKNKLMSLDATTISLCLSVFPWAEFRRKKGGVKAHVLLDHDDYMPRFISITPANKADVKVAQKLRFTKGSILAIDRGYVDYAMFGRWCADGVYFVTRLKDNAVYYKVIEHAPPKNRNILADQTIVLTQKMEVCPHLLRRVVVWDPEGKREIVLLTNNRKLGASTIAAIYKDRWEIELFFKALKQNLKVKTFVGTSENALRIQIWTALIALLLLKWLHHLSKANWSLSTLAAMLRMNLFTYRNLMDWINDPFRTPPIIPEPVQLSFFSNRLGQAIPKSKQP